MQIERTRLCRICQFLQYFATNYKNIIIDFQILTLFKFVNIAEKQIRIEQMRQSQNLPIKHYIDKFYFKI
jgi:hypothetical protein